ncbi:MAG: hypothetical protein F9K23_00745 [Bacteroidetes bacterium]|nr:MAG: hypothetical protein F9K23_00745 [Bacteroidota bacterium]
MAVQKGFTIFVSEMALTDKKNQAKQLYLETDLTQKDIAAMLCVSEVTLSKWAQKGNWEGEKAADLLSKTSLVKMIYDEIAAKKKAGERLSADDAIKYAKAIDLVSSKSVNASSAINVFKQFTAWLQGRDLKTAKQIISFQKEFVAELLTNGTSN